jgi:type II secretory pathway pseudopilin PulG
MRIHKHRHLHRAITGFTIVELMVATVVFSMILLLCATAIVQVGRMYYKGVVINRTEDTSRRVIDDVARSIQFGASGPSNAFRRSPPAWSPPDSPVPGVKTLCLGTVRYTFAPKEYVLGPTYNATNKVLPHVLWKNQVSSADTTCRPADLSSATLSDGGTELLGDNMRLSEGISAAPVSLTSNLWKIRLTVAYGEGNGVGTPPDYGVFLDDTFMSCLNRNSGGEFCAVSSLNTTVVKRLLGE